MVIWLTERCCAGLAPEIPEDLYCLIKKVSSPRGPEFAYLNVLTRSPRLSPSASTLSATARTATPSSASF